VGKIRTSWDLSVILGIPFSRWGASPFICSPIAFRADTIVETGRENRQETDEPSRRPLPFHLALKWKRQISDDPNLNQSKIAAREGLSRARVTQVMNLLRLPGAVQAGLRTPPTPLEIHSFTERSLRALVSSGNEETGAAHWRELVRQLQSSVAK